MIQWIIPQIWTLWKKILTWREKKIARCAEIMEATTEMPNTKSMVSTQNAEKGEMSPEFSNEEQGKTLEFELPNEVVDLITENQSKTVFFFMRGIPIELDFYKWAKTKWENRGWEIEIIRGLGKGYVSCMFKST